MNYIGRLVVVVLLAVAACHLAAASLNIQEAGVSVLYPEKKLIDMSMADFGLPKYGGFLRGELVYISSQGSYYNNQSYKCFPTDCEYACDLNMSVPSVSLPKLPGTAWIMMVDRGPKDRPCYFLDKVYNAQLAGADAVLVADDKDEDLTTAVAPDTDDTVGERRNLDIYAGVIKKVDADYLRDLLRASRVGLLLNFTASVPQSAKVTWEYWGGTTDVCGYMCEERVNFTLSIKSTAAKLEQSGQTSFTPRFFLEDCREGTTNTTECQSNCFSNGRYCARPSLNYTGKDVLRMNIRSKCFFTVNSEGIKSYLWWEFMSQLFSNCSMAKGQFTPECAGKVYDAVNKLQPIADKAQWEACSTNFNETDEKIAVLEEELMAQLGNNTTPPVKPVIIEPTIRINGAQYRGSLRAGAVLRALCAAFPAGHEPDVCNENWVSDDECVGPYGEGYVKCRVGESGNRTRCVNTFQGYQCTCGAGFQLVLNPVAGDEVCEDINECAISNAPYKQSDCNCDRCGCINTPGSYKCTGEKENRCTEKYKYGGCWFQTFNFPDGANKTLTRCMDMIQDYKHKSYIGKLTDDDTWFRCGDCPPCFDATADGNCVLRCSDLSQCDQTFGYCRGSEAGGGGSKGSGKNGNGVHPGFMILVALGAAALTGFVVMVANHVLMKKRMGEEIRDIMAAYMPLQEDRSPNSGGAVVGRGGFGGRGGGGRGGGYQERIIRPDEDSDEEGHVGAYGWSTGRPAAAPAIGGGSSTDAAPPTLIGASQRAVWGPAPPPPAAATTAAGPTFGMLSPSTTPKPAAAEVPLKATIDVFGSGSGGGSAAAGVVAAPAVPPAGEADPLLGRQLSGSSGTIHRGGDAASGVGGSGGVENPFL